MSVALEITPASGSVVATSSACRIDVSDADGSDTAAFDADAYPTMPEIRYYITAELAGVERGRSHVFSPNGGSHQWNGYIFPAAGSWTLRLKKESDDSDVATLAVTVS